MRQCEKFCRAGQTTDDNLAHARYMLDTESFKHTLIIRNYFSTATTVARTRLNANVTRTLPVLFK